MDLKIDAVTLGVRDLNAAKRFYHDGLGCALQQESPHFVSFRLGEGSSVLSLYPWEALAGDAGVPAGGSGFRGVTLSYIVRSDDQVNEVLSAAERAGGSVVQPGQRAAWGGYSGHFADTDGYLWKVAATG